MKSQENDMDCLFRIGEVAEMFDCSIRTLRLYDKMGLFTPAHVDPDTGYRHYMADQMPLLNTILVLRVVGFHLLEIRDLLRNGMETRLLLDRLEHKRETLEGEMEVLRFKQENVQRILDAVRTTMTRQDTMPEAPASPPPPAGASAEPGDIHAPKPMDEAYRMSRLICLENIKLDHTLSEVLWL